MDSRVGGGEDRKDMEGVGVWGEETWFRNSISGTKQQNKISEQCQTSQELDSLTH